MFRKLVSLDEAQRTLKAYVSPKPIGVEQISISQACSRVLARDVVASINVPPFDRAIVDGYAVKAEDTFGAEEDRPVALEFSGEIQIGMLPSITVERGTAAEIVTGAPLPKGADAVVMMEYTSRKGTAIVFHRPVSKGENIMKAGSDIKKGETILKKSEALSSRKIGALAAIGLTEVEVYRRPVVAILSTGGEIVGPGESLPPGRIYDINAHTLSAAVVECGGEPANFGVVPDEIDCLKTTIQKALNSANVVITSGGVSVGPKDIVPEVVAALGEPGVIVCGVAMKPGKPTTIALINGKPVFSLPGHPTSSLLAFHIFARPTICRMGGRAEEPFAVLKALAATRMFPARGRRTFIMVKLVKDASGSLLASPVPLGLSGAITTLTKAEGFVKIREERQFVDVGDEVAVYLFNPKRRVLQS
jgi:molybdenum cofactor synthesis domain-containing protein